MTSKNELEKLLTECEACAEEDERSYEEHFAECPACKEHAEKAEGLNKMMEVLELMAAKPLDTRKQILGARIRKFLSLPAGQRKMAISELMDALGELPEESMIKIVKARTDLMMEIPKEHRQTLMQTLSEIMTEWPQDRKMREREAIIKATEDYFFLKRKIVRKKFGQLLG